VTNKYINHQKLIKDHILITWARKIVEYPILAKVFERAGGAASTALQSGQAVAASRQLGAVAAQLHRFPAQAKYQTSLAIDQ